MANVTSPSNSNPIASRFRLGEVIGRFGPALGLAVVWGLFALLVGPDFTAWGNQRLMLLQTAVVGTAAIGATLVIISGGIDLSVGSAIAAGTMVVALLLKAGVPPFLAALGSIVAGVILGLGIGAIIVGHVGPVLCIGLGGLVGRFAAQSDTQALPILLGICVAVIAYTCWRNYVGRIELSPFIVTLGMWGALRGAAKGLGDNQPVYPEQTWLTDLMQPASSGLFSILVPGVWFMLVLALVMAGVLRYTRFGRHVYAVGSNQLTARLCGVSVNRTKVMVYGVAVGCAGAAAVFQFAFLYGVGDPTTAEGYELKVIAAVVIGGASLMGGEGTILGTILGALIMTVVDNGCTKLGLANWVQEIVTGGIIISAVTLDQMRHRQSR